MSDLDELMNKDPLELSDQDIDEIIAYNRKVIGAVEEGKKATVKSAKPVDLAGLGLLKNVQTMKRPEGL